VNVDDADKKDLSGFRNATGFILWVSVFLLMGLVSYECTMKY